jgi:hypothetical protein
MSPELAPPGWRPVFLDYLHLGFTNATAFSPTDVMPLTHRAKYTMMADNYMLAVVLFASALFFAGISTKLHSINARRAVLGLGWVLFLGTAIWLATFPVQLTT